MAQWVKVAVGLGSNLSNPEFQLALACQTLSAHSQIRYFDCSSFHHSKPLGPQDQPDFVNAVCVFETELTAESLLSLLQKIEQDQGRVKERHWGERLIDLDILLYGMHQVCLPNLTIPHSYITERDFVLFPLLEIWPEAEIPGKGAVLSCIENLANQYLLPKTSIKGVS
ncbi:2-amino-4-hydroxy-6-hydroxymethyldihydropteridine diphosphokinase [Thiomicrospira sp. R3]|uniref:2-amino-4-hydroxy-6- hydroxymethyldihydropteridine diphosphokinase n=1 Tax=Thiomicrospira sp. R3 TaxID=3035472 RepID=UPI00259AF84E|nr:2-amino-4-hydroxy-6-hydroxymethyldihydropteridine diphosphokinase [Thiomicrospira sp. R3]WFE69064.1 2-amino-4-hydroxy-6-hydroxymethyldihydropteridine diphosphokinase [Thiomicrospira sp. R3]